mmetsp:Transcript_2033/g.3326  ORF Transcript_2033/g.3326 Transcript_2033/m.3326 type:complete len:616 (-) Transcript_2033:325-2172(-)
MPPNAASFTLSALLQQWCVDHSGHAIEFTDVDPSLHANDVVHLKELFEAGDRPGVEEHALYKTRLCTHHENGHCPRGALCFHAHDAQELRLVRADAGEPQYLYALTLQQPDPTAPVLDFCNLDPHPTRNEAKTDLAGQCIQALGLRVVTGAAGRPCLEDDSNIWRTFSRPPRPSPGAASAQSSSAEPRPTIPAWRKRQLLEVVGRLSRSEAAQAAAAQGYDRWMACVGGTFGSSQPKLARVLRLHYGGFKEFVAVHAGQIRPPTPAPGQPAQPSAEPQQGPELDAVIALLVSTSEPANAAADVESNAAGTERPHEAILHVVETAGADGIELRVLKVQLETMLQLSRTIKTFKLAMYLKKYPSFFRTTGEGMSIDRIFYMGDEGGEGHPSSAWHATLWQDEVEYHRRVLISRGIDKAAVMMMSSDDLIGEGVPAGVVERMLALPVTAATEQTDAVCAASVFAGAGMVSDVAERMMALPVTAPAPPAAAPVDMPSSSSLQLPTCTENGSAYSSSRGGRGGRGGRSDYRDPALLVQVSELRERCARLQLRVNLLEEARLCAVCMERKRDTLVLPCMHAMFCSMCLRGPTPAHRCPVCRGYIAGLLECRLNIDDDTEDG